MGGGGVIGVIGCNSESRVIGEVMMWCVILPTVAFGYSLFIAGLKLALHNTLMN